MNVMAGEHVIRMVSEEDLPVKWIGNFQDAGHTAPDLTVVFQRGYGIPFRSTEVTVMEEGAETVYRRDDYLLVYNHSLKKAVIDFYDDFALKHAVINLYSALIIREEWGLLIHSSCVLDKHKAHLFAGHSGAGKSTAAALSKPRWILSDEATVVKVKDGDITVFNSPFRSEIESNGQEARFSLSSIEFLCQASSNNRKELPKSEAMIGMMDKVFCWGTNAADTERIFRLLGLLADSVPAFRLDFQKNNTFWELIS